MKRVLAWLALFGCYMGFCLVVKLDLLLVGYIISLYAQLSALAKLLIIILGGTGSLSLLVAPLYYGIPLTISACESIYPSKKGTRYLVMGILIVVSCFLEMISDFMIRDIIIGIYGIVLIINGRNSQSE